MKVNYINEEIRETMIRNNNILTTSMVTSLGYSKTLLTNYVRSGLLVKIQHGVYSFPNIINDDMYLLMLKSDKIIFSHETALFLNGLSERTPTNYCFTIQSNTSVAKSLKGNNLLFYIKPELFKLGLIEEKNNFGNTIRYYNLERTICDLLRNRSRIDKETIVFALKNYILSVKKDLNRLYIYGRQFGVEKLLTTYMEVLL